MHDPQKCIDFLWKKLAAGELLEWGRTNPVCALHKLSCIVAYGTDKFCDDDEPEDDTVPLVIGENVDAEEFRAKVAKIDCELCGTDPMEQNAAQGLVDQFLKDALVRIVKKLIEEWLDK